MLTFGFSNLRNTILVAETNIVLQFLAKTPVLKVIDQLVKVLKENLT